MVEVVGGAPSVVLGRSLSLPIWTQWGGWASTRVVLRGRATPL